MHHLELEDGIRSKVVMRSKALLAWRKGKKRHRNDNQLVAKVPRGLPGVQSKMWERAQGREVGQTTLRAADERMVLEDLERL